MIKNHNLNLISNTCSKLSFLNKLFSHLKCSIIAHEIEHHIYEGNVKNYLYVRNMRKITSLQHNINDIYIAISSIHIAHGRVLNTNQLNSMELIQYISGKRYKIYTLVTIKHNEIIRSKLSQEIYTNIYYKSMRHIAEQYSVDIVIRKLLPRTYHTVGSVEQSICCLLNHLLK